MVGARGCGYFTIFIKICKYPTILRKKRNFVQKLQRTGKCLCNLHKKWGFLKGSFIFYTKTVSFSLFLFLVFFSILTMKAGKTPANI